MSDGFQLKPLHPIATVLEHLRLIILIAVIGTVVSTVMILSKVRPEYRAEAGIEVELMHSRVLVWDQEKQFSSRTQYTDYINTQLKYIKSYENVTEAISRIDPKNPAFQAGSDPQQNHFRFVRKLEAKAVRNTHLMVVAVKGDQPEGLADLVNTVIDTYMDRVRDHELGKNDNRILHLKKELDRQRNELLEAQKLLTDHSLNLQILDLGRTNNPHDESMSFLRAQYNESAIRRIKAENAYRGMVERVQKEKGLDLNPLVEELIMQDLSTIDMRNKVFENRQELFRQSASMTENHPNRKNLEENVALTQEYLDQIQEDLRKKGREIVAGKNLLKQERELIAFRGIYDEAVKDENDVRIQYESELANLQEMTPVFLNARQIAYEIEHHKERISQIESRIEELTIETREPGRIRIQTRARDPLFPHKDRRKMLLMVGAMFSLFMGLLAAFAIDLLHPSIIDARHMAMVIGQRPTGILFEQKENDYGQLLRDHPNSFHADQFKRIMPRIFDAPSPHIVTILATANAHGVTSFSLNCATHLAGTGCDVSLLQIAANEPDLEQRLASWDLKKEFFTVELEHKAMELDRYSDGKHLECYLLSNQEARTELANEQTLAQLLEILSKNKQVLLIDAPPLFQNSEAEMLCRNAQTSVLVVNGPQTAPGALKRALSLLEELGVKRCAVIGNNLPALPGGFFTRSVAAFEGKDLKYPLLHDLIAAIRGALDPRNRKW